MGIPFQAYTGGGIVRGTLASETALDELLQEGGPAFELAGATHSLLSGGSEQADPMRLERDELLLIVAPAEAIVEIHASWHELAIHIGPFRVDGELAMQPGFDPTRALARPTGEFILLRDVRVALIEDPAGDADEHPWCWVNRYLVEQVRSNIDLGQFFPGAIPAQLVPPAPAPDLSSAPAAPAAAAQ